MTFADPADLAETLITHANGLTAAGAATGLICAHRSWLTNTGFVDGFITAGARPGGQPYAYIHWDDAITALDAHQLGGSSSENNILRIAASLGDHRIPVHLAAASATSTTPTSTSSPPPSPGPTAATPEPAPRIDARKPRRLTSAGPSPDAATRPRPMPADLT